MTRAAREANEREQASTVGESRFPHCGACRPIHVTEKALKLKLALKIHGKRRSKKNLEKLYEVLAPGPNILKEIPTTSTIKEPGKPIVTVCNTDIAKFGTIQERQTPLRVSENRRGPRSCEKLEEERIQTHIKQITRKFKDDKKMKHRKRDPGSGVSSSCSNISRNARGHP